MSYTPGLHILSEIYSDELLLLNHSHLVKEFLSERVQFYQLTQVGENYHDFEFGGFTGVICLTESHLAIHTWPEYGMLTLDIYLSNNRKRNDEKARNFFEDIVAFFKSNKYTRKEVSR